MRGGARRRDRTDPALAGVTFGAALHIYELGIPLGLLTSDSRTLVNPDMDTPIRPGDQLIVPAEDDLLIRPATKRDRLVEAGAEVHVAAPVRPDEALDRPRTNLTVHHKPCRTTNRPSPESLDLGSYQHIIVLSHDDVEPGHADDRTLITLLHLRDIEERLGDPFSIVTEMNDDDNREVAQVTKADDFIVGSRLIRLLLTQLSENRHLHGVFATLFDPSGSEIYLKPASSSVRPGVAANFATVLESPRRRGDTALGYRLHDHSQEAPAYGVRLNPPKDAELVLEAHDSVIVLAES
ncbi:hypothetical protein AB0K12_27925 [Nonomuraea sp. NPDC049419]|uniref:CASTOR/POLLUX-related putative ion channel n=1 Tax=Nonomuraea sp. NPDC049419 TaxID=3155772 RepID=UPI00343F7BC4